MPRSDLFSQWESGAPEHLTTFVLPGDFLLMQQQLLFPLLLSPTRGVESRRWSRGMGTDSGEKAGHRADSVVHDVLLEMTDSAEGGKSW